VAIGGYRGFIIMWNYEKKNVVWENNDLSLKEFSNNKVSPTALGFPPNGV